MMTLRLDTLLQQKVSDVAHSLGLSKSELVRKSLVEYLSKAETSNAWESGQNLFGKYASNDGNLAANRKIILQQKLKAKTSKEK